jgi:hypothetical protein
MKNTAFSLTLAIVFCCSAKSVSASTNPNPNRYKVSIEVKKGFVSISGRQHGIPKDYILTVYSDSIFRLEEKSEAIFRLNGEWCARSLNNDATPSEPTSIGNVCIDKGTGQPLGSALKEATLSHNVEKNEDRPYLIYPRFGIVTRKEDGFLKIRWNPVDKTETYQIDLCRKPKSFLNDIDQERSICPKGFQKVGSMEVPHSPLSIQTVEYSPESLEDSFEYFVIVQARLKDSNSYSLRSEADFRILKGEVSEKIKKDIDARVKRIINWTGREPLVSRNRIMEAQLYANEGYYQKAIEIMQELVAEKPDTANVSMLAKMYEDIGLPIQAVELYQSVLAINALPNADKEIIQDSLDALKLELGKTQ